MNKVEQSGIDDDGGNLKGNGRQGAGFCSGKTAWFKVLNDQYANGFFAVQQWNAKKGMKLLFACLLKVTVTGVILGLFCCHHSAFFHNQAGQAFTPFHGNLAHRYA